MIFNNNATSLGAYDIPMAEGYDCSFGAALALVESARNDYAMFQAMIGADYREMQICKESAGSVMEGEVASLHEAVGGGIWAKIKELFSKLIAKVKGIFHNFIAKIRGLWMKDKDLVKKYGPEVAKKTNIGNLEVKWRKVKKAIDWSDTATSITLDDLAANWKNERDEIFKHYSDGKSETASEYAKALEEEYLEDEDTVKLSEAGGIRSIMSFLEGYGSKSRKMESNINKFTNALAKMVKDADTKAKDVAKEKGYDPANADVQKANHAYESAVVFQDVKLTLTSTLAKLSTTEYKQNKAAFMKAVTANNSKLAEATYLDAVAEAAEQEVEDVIGSALSDEELSELCSASKNVKDGDVTDDPDALTYGPNQYTKNACFGSSDGSIDTHIDSKKESAFFGELLY